MYKARLAGKCRYLSGLAELTSSLLVLASREHTMVSDSSELCLSTLLITEVWDGSIGLVSVWPPCTEC